MNPIPLSAPDGRVYAYACGTCHLVAGGSTPMWREDGPPARIVDGSKLQAESCCRCLQCKRPMSRLDGIECADCRWLNDMGRVWRMIGEGYTDKPCPICGAQWTGADCRSRPACSACGEDHAGVGGKCRDCNLYGANA